MARKSPYESYHHFPKIAEESGFAFNIHRPNTRIDWNKIKSIDIENVIRDRRFIVVEQHLSDIMNCMLDSEFDVRILDEGVVKMFRLAQLAVEYQQFCRHYLDRSVHLLRDEVTALAQELDATKKKLHEKEDELTKLKRKSRYTYKSRNLYGNDNIASVLLKTLTNRSDLFPGTSNGKDGMLYNKCTYCDKVFLNQIYLKSHLTRRHPNVVAIPQKDVASEIDPQPKIEEENKLYTDPGKENTILSNEVKELKKRLKEMENIIAELKTVKSPETPTNSQNANSEVQLNKREVRTIPTPVKTKDAEVLTNHEDYLVNKIEELKKAEFDKYNIEIHSLRSQIIETINSLQRTENPDTQLIEQLHATIKQQSNEIIGLKQDIQNAKLKCVDEENERKKEMEAQRKMWATREENQAKQYETLLIKLNEMSKEAQEARVLTEVERKRGEHLQILLEETVSQNHKKNFKNMKKLALSDSENNEKPVRSQLIPPNANREVLENLQRKAQELLSGTMTSSSDTFSESDNKTEMVTTKTKPKMIRNKIKTTSDVVKNSNSKERIKNIDKKKFSPSNQVVTTDNNRKKIKEKSKSHSNVSLIEEKSLRAPGSPVKLLRAKITEEVNNRIVEFGIDPFKRKISDSEWRKQRLQLQRQVELKSKKNPAYGKVRNYLVAHLDTSIQNEIINSDLTKQENKTSPSKLSKTFNLSSVLSNVKSKALSLVKSKDHNETVKHRKDVNDVSLKHTAERDSPKSSPDVSPAVVQRNTLSKNYSDRRKTAKEKQIVADEKDSDERSSESNRYYNSKMTENATEAVLNLIKSPIRRPYSADIVASKKKKEKNENGRLGRAKSATSLTELSGVNLDRKTFNKPLSNDDSSDPTEEQLDKHLLEVNTKIQTKGVLKNASSTSSLNKKKVLFDMEAIQMKSVSASPSQSTTEKFEDNFELGLVNLESEEWDISSIENEPVKNDTKTQIKSLANTKVAELTKSIESQLAHRKETESAIVGGVDVLGGPLRRVGNFGGSNTSLGSSILDESDSC